MKPFLHARVTVKQFGGKPDDYIDIHEFMDWPKSAHPDVRFRAILHNSFGPYLAEKVFGNTIINSDGKEVCVRDIIEQHIIDDLGFIPTVSDWLNHMELPPWGAGIRTTTKHIPFAGGKTTDVDYKTLQETIDEIKTLGSHDGRSDRCNNDRHSNTRPGFRD